jgi:serine/threonine protein kinase
MKPKTAFAHGTNCSEAAKQHAVHYVYLVGMQFNPSKRLTAAEALAHPYVAQFHNPDDEPSCSKVITIPINDNHKYSIQVGGHL